MAAGSWQGPPGRRRDAVQRRSSRSAARLRATTRGWLFDAIRRRGGVEPLSPLRRRAAGTAARRTAGRGGENTVRSCRGRRDPSVLRVRARRGAEYRRDADSAQPAQTARRHRQVSGEQPSRHERRGDGIACAPRRHDGVPDDGIGEVLDVAKRDRRAEPPGDVQPGDACHRDGCGIARPADHAPRLRRGPAALTVHTASANFGVTPAGGCSEAGDFGVDGPRDIRRVRAAPEVGGFGVDGPRDIANVEWWGRPRGRSEVGGFGVDGPRDIRRVRAAPRLVNAAWTVHAISATLARAPWRAPRG